MKILSVRQPWAWLIVNGIKDLENRDWTTRYRGLVLIHAGKTFEDDAVYGILNKLDERERACFPMKKSAFERGGIVGIANLADVVTCSESKWAVGTSYGWLFNKVRPLPLIPMRGSPLLLDAPEDIVAQVKAMCRKASVA